MQPKGELGFMSNRMLIDRHNECTQKKLEITANDNKIMGNHLCDKIL